MLISNFFIHNLILMTSHVFPTEPSTRMSSFLDSLFFLFDDKSVFHVLLLLSSASLASVFQCVHRLYEEKAQAVSGVETHKVCKEFADFLQNCPDKTLKYVAISGLVATSSKPLEAQGRPDIKGVSFFNNFSLNYW